MTKKELNLQSNLGTTIIFLALFGILGYFVYGGLNGALSVILLGIAYDLSILIGLIPFIGFIVQAIVMKFLWIFISDLTGIGPTVLTTWMYWIHLDIGAIGTCITTILVLKNVYK